MYTFRVIKWPLKRQLLAFCSFPLFALVGFAQSNLSYSIDVPGNRSFILLANPLDRGSNTLNNVLSGVPDGCLLFKFDNTNATWQGSAYNAALNSWIPGGIKLRPGDGAFLQSPTNFTLVFQGNPHVPVLPITIPEGAVFLLSSQSNGIGTYERIVGTPAPDLAAVYKWTGSNYAVFYADGYSASGWDDALFMDVSPPTAAIGEAIWISPSGWEPYDPPQLDCPASKTVACGSSWSFDLPSVFGPCDGTNVVITQLNTVTNGNGCQRVITRTWQIVDLCSNALTCSQTVRIMDNEPPVLTCATNKTVECGSCFSGTNPRHFSVLKTFSAIGADGQNPFPGLIQASDGWLYGVTENGGSNGVGTIFKIATDGSGYAVVHHFQNSGGDGITPKASLLEAVDGKLYGTTSSGGDFGQGTAFRLDKSGGSYEVLKSFTSSDGWSPQSALIQGTNGALYGTTVYGGNSAAGTVFTVNPDGTGFTVLKHFTGSSDGGNPQSSLLLASDGLLYATTYGGGTAGVGTVFQINQEGSNYQVIYSFSSGNDARNPTSALIEGSDGILYGTTRSGGNSGIGTVYKLGKDGSGYAVLRSFMGADGNEPWAGVVEVCGGDLGGTTRFGGTNGTGAVFKLSKDGTNYSQIYSFPNLSEEGQNPCGSILAARDGALYGTAAYGGSNGVGTIFSLSGSSAWQFDPPAAYDTCCGSNVTLTVLSTVTNGTACSQAITRTWQATDCCTNTTTCSQTVLIRDSRAPLFLDSPTNVTLIAGQDLTLSASLAGATPLSILLLNTNGALRAISATSSFFLPALLPSDSGQYFLLASNVFGTAVSASFQIQASAPSNMLALVDADNALKIIGTDGDDDVEIRLSVSDPTLVEVADVKNPPVAWAFPTNGLSAIIVDLATGHDRVTFNATNALLLTLPEPDIVQDNTTAYGKTESSDDSDWSMNCPADITYECSPYNQYNHDTLVPFSVPSATYHNFWTGDHTATVVCNYPGYNKYSQSAPFPVGTTTVTFTAKWTNNRGKEHKHDCSFRVTVHDTTPPYLCKPFTSVFSTNFNVGSPPGITRYGNAIVQNGVLKLTRNIGSQFGAVIVKDFHHSLITAFNATFKLLIGGGTSPGGEGFSFNLASDLPATPTAANANEEGMGTGLTISFDTRNSGPGDAIGIELRNGGALIIRASTQASQGPSGTAFKDVSISLGFDGVVDVIYDGVHIINDVTSGYVPVPDSRFALAARTQTATDNHWVDDLRIEAKSPRPDVVVTAETTSCGRTISPQDVFNPVQTYFCDTCDSHFTVAYTPPLPHMFPTGTNKLCFAVSDSYGNASIPHCIDVVVLDKTPPVLSCANLPVLTSNGCVATVPDFRGYVAPTDNCTPNNQIFVTQDPAPGSIFEQGTYPITIIACDAAGNCSQCMAPATFIVTGSTTPIPGLHNTGLDANDQPLAGGSVDGHFTSLTFTPKVVTQPTPWDGTLPNTATSQWLGTNAAGSGTAGNYTYSLGFYLPCFEPGSVQIHGRWASDNSAKISVNGKVTSQTTPSAGYNQWTSFDLLSDFQVGANTLDFVVTDGGGVSDSTGLRVEFLNATYVTRCCAGNNQPPSGLVLWIPFDEPDTSGFAHNLVHAVNGTYLGTPSLPGVNNGYVDRSLCFNGANQGVRVAYYPEIDIGKQSFTIDAWVRRSLGDAGTRQIVDHRVAGRGYALYLNNGALTFFASDAVSSLLTTGPTVPADNTWHFIAVVVKRNADDPPSSATAFWLDKQSTAFSAGPIAGIPLGNLNGLTIGAKNAPPAPLDEVFNGCIDEVEIFNRALSPVEIANLYNALNIGKFKYTCQVPGLGFCPGVNTLTATATICNRSSEPVTFVYGLRGLLAACGNLSEPLTIGNTPGSVTIEPWHCQNVSFSVPRPVGLTAGKSGCVVLEVYPLGKDGVIQAKSTVYPVQTLNCAYPVGWPNGSLGFQNAAHGSFTAGPIGLPNPYDTNYVLNYRIRAVGPDGTDDQRVISLNGLPPGTPVTNSVLLAPGAYTMVTVNGQFVVDDPEKTYQIWLEADMDGDGTLDPLYVLPVTEYYPAQLEIRPISVDLNGDTITDAVWPGVSWFGDGVLQTTPALNQPWTDIPSAPNPYPFSPTNSARFFRLRQ